MPTPIVFAFGEHSLSGTLNDSATAQKLLERLPLAISMSRWGEEYYGSVGTELGQDLEDDARDEMAVGELAYWPPGNAFCVFFGPTPVSRGDEPRAASDVNPIGMLDGPFDQLKAAGGSIQATLRKG